MAYVLVQERRNSSALAMELRLSCANPIDVLVQERRNSSALAMELRLSCPNPIDVLMQERRNSSALAMELRLFCTNPSTWMSWRLKSPNSTATRLFVQANSTKNTKATHCWTFVRETTCHCWILFTKGPVMHKACPSQDGIMVEVSYYWPSVRRSSLMGDHCGTSKC